MWTLWYSAIASLRPNTQRGGRKPTLGADGCVAVLLCGPAGPCNPEYHRIKSGVDGCIGSISRRPSCPRSPVCPRHPTCGGGRTLPRWSLPPTCALALIRHSASEKSNAMRLQNLSPGLHLPTRLSSTRRCRHTFLHYKRPTSTLQSAGKPRQNRTIHSQPQQARSRTDPTPDHKAAEQRAITYEERIQFIRRPTHPRDPRLHTCSPKAGHNAHLCALETNLSPAHALQCADYSPLAAQQCGGL